jgi:hypothetical protein
LAPPPLKALALAVLSSEQLSSRRPSPEKCTQRTDDVCALSTVDLPSLRGGGGWGGGEGETQRVRARVGEAVQRVRKGRAAGVGGCGWDGWAVDARAIGLSGADCRLVLRWPPLHGSPLQAVHSSCHASCMVQGGRAPAEADGGEEGRAF